jgi:hypothetical protein
MREWIPTGTASPNLEESFLGTNNQSPTSNFEIEDTILVVDVAGNGGAIQVADVRLVRYRWRWTR